MKKAFVAVATSLMVIALSAHPMQASAAASDPYGNTVLETGASGSDVLKLQEDLRCTGYFSASKDTGYYGSITAAAVKQFQADHGLHVDGRVGEQTAAKLASIALGDRAVEFGLQYKGVPYVWGGSTPSGFDCSGFVQYVYHHLGVSLPRTAASMFQVGSNVSRSSLQTGDLVFFTTYCPGASHVGIYAGNGQFLSATSKGVTYSGLTNSYWSARYLGAKRIY